MSSVWKHVCLLIFVRGSCVSSLLEATITQQRLDCVSLVFCLFCAGFETCTGSQKGQLERMCGSNYERERYQTSEGSPVSLTLVYCLNWFMTFFPSSSSYSVIFCGSYNYWFNLFQVQGGPTRLSVTDNRIQLPVYICGGAEKGSLQLRGPKTWGTALEGTVSASICMTIIVYPRWRNTVFVYLPAVGPVDANSQTGIKDNQTVGRHWIPRRWP